MSFSIWVLVLIGVVGMPTVTAVVLYRGGIDVGLGARKAGLVAGAVGVGWGIWTVASGLLAAAGAYRQDPVQVRPWIAVALAGALAVALLATRIPVIARILSAPGMATRLALPQTVRVVGVAFFIALALGKLPAVFTLPAGLGDIAVGLAAPFVARRSRRGLVWFNALGILDLVVAVSVGFLAGQGPTDLIPSMPSTAQIALLPLALIPTSAVPLALALHVASLNRVAKASENGRSPAPVAR